MANQSKTVGGVRIGPLSLLTLVSVLLLAVLAVLCITTTNAANALSRRQASSATETYAVDACGQAMVAAIDEAIDSADGDAADSVAASIDDIRTRALELAGVSDVELSASVDGSDVSFTVTAPDGRTLTAVVSVNDDAYTITSWKMTTTQPDSQESLWAGTDAAQ